jgi:hypothetical protein
MRPFLNLDDISSSSSSSMESCRLAEPVSVLSGTL